MLSYECTLCRRRGVFAVVENRMRIVCAFCGGAGALVEGAGPAEAIAQPRCQNCEAAIGPARLKAAAGTRLCATCAARSTGGLRREQRSATRRSLPER